MALELLSPAGERDSLTAAVQNGADAVYLGGRAFSARRYAGNFDDAALREALDYCHIRGVKAYVAVNTLLLDRELNDALSTPPIYMKRARTRSSCRIWALCARSDALCRS